MIRLFSRFGRSALILTITLSVGVSAQAWAIGSSGAYATRIKVEYQYSDYNRYDYPPPVRPVYPETEWTQNDPYIAEFPEHRGLVSITQSLGIRSAVQIKYQYSDIDRGRIQDLVYARFASEVSPYATLYASWQSLQHPDAVTWHMPTCGIRLDYSGAVLTDYSFSVLLNNEDDNTNRIQQSLTTRWAIDRLTAVTLRGELLYDAKAPYIVNNTNAISTYALALSRYLPTQTAVHLYARFYNSNRVESWSPSVEVAQYISYNLTARCTYRYYNNSIYDDELLGAISGESIASHSVRLNLDWQIHPEWLVSLKLRRYWSDQNIILNTYLLGWEYQF